MSSTGEHLLTHSQYAQAKRLAAATGVHVDDLIHRVRILASVSGVSLADVFRDDPHETPRDAEPVDIAEMDAFDLRAAIAHGLTQSDGLRVDVVDADTLMVIGTDSAPHPKHGLYLTTGRLLHVTRDSGGEQWWCERDLRHWKTGHHSAVSLADLDSDLAWVRRRSDP